MKIVFASDIHGKWDKVEWPKGDVLCLAGDILANYVYGQGCVPETSEQIRELRKMGDHLKAIYKDVILVSGNHDWCFFRDHSATNAIDACKEVGITYLCDGYAEIDGVVFYGSPWQPYFYNWAFNFPNPEKDPVGAYRRAIDTWAEIRRDTNVLITHGPPRNILDLTYDGRAVGCKFLRERIEQLEKLKIHAFGHIHFARGKYVENNKTFLNVSLLDEDYQLVHKPMVEEI